MVFFLVWSCGVSTSCLSPFKSKTDRRKFTFTCIDCTEAQPLPDDRGVFFWSARRPVARGKPGGLMGGWDLSKATQLKRRPTSSCSCHSRRRGQRGKIKRWEKRGEGCHIRVHCTARTVCAGSTEAEQENNGKSEASSTCLK